MNSVIIGYCYQHNREQYSTYVYLPAHKCNDTECHYNRCNYHDKWQYYPPCLPEAQVKEDKHYDETNRCKKLQVMPHVVPNYGSHVGHTRDLHALWSRDLGDYFLHLVKYLEVGHSDLEHAYYSCSLEVTGYYVTVYKLVILKPLPKLLLPGWCLRDNVYCRGDLHHAVFFLDIFDIKDAKHLVDLAQIIHLFRDLLYTLQCGWLEYIVGLNDHHYHLCAAKGVFYPIHIHLGWEIRRDLVDDIRIYLRPWDQVGKGHCYSNEKNDKKPWKTHHYICNFFKHTQLHLYYLSKKLFYR